MRSNPPWSTKILGKHWQALEQRVGPALMPLPREEADGLEALRKREAELLHSRESDKAWSDTQLTYVRQDIKHLLKKPKKEWGYREFGCGHYGCVMPTGTPGTVIKVTTDPTEAGFIAAYLSLPPRERPVGIIPYHRIIAIQSESHKKRPVFVLWRDEARWVGEISDWVQKDAREFERDYYRTSFYKVQNLMSDCKDTGSIIRNMTLRRKDAREIIAEAMTLRDEVYGQGRPAAVRGNAARILAFYINEFDNAAQNMTSEPMGSYVGQAMHECLELGLLLADVHGGNIGLPVGALAEEIGQTPIITDPGHAIALTDRFAGVQMEVL